jgi:chorismate synthase
LERTVKTMSANSFGQIFKMTSFGESHGSALGVIVEGCPAGLEFNQAFLQSELDRRRPGFHGDPSQAVTSARKESDQVEVLSGVFEGKTLGTPIAMIVRNQDQRSGDYEIIKTSVRVGHADDVWKNKFGHSDHRGGGRSSGRETVSRVMAGAVAKMLLQKLVPGLLLRSYVSQIGEIVLNNEEKDTFSQSLQTAEAHLLRMPSQKNNLALEMLKRAQEQGESFGGVVSTFIHAAPAGLGQPVFRKLKSDLAQAMLSIGATSGFAIGDGFSAASKAGTQFHQSAHSENYGGLRGGISTGEALHFEVSFKPTSSILDTARKGRHDPCIAIRATPVVEAMAALVLADHLLWQRIDKI